MSGLIALALVLLSQDGAEPRKAASSEVVARIGGRVITADALRREMLIRAQEGGSRYRTPAQREALLDEMARNAVLASAAVAAGYNDDADILAALDRILAEKYLADRVTAGLKPPTDDEIARFYEKNAAEYGGGERRRGSFIHVRVPKGASVETKKSLEKRAALAASEARGPEANAFAIAASRHSDDTATRYVGGDMGWVQNSDAEYRWDRSITEALFAIRQAGEVAGPIAAADGFYVVKLVEKTDGKPRPLAAVKQNIVQRILQDRRSRLQQSIYEAARRQVPIDIDRKTLASIEAPPEIPASGEEPPPLPGSSSPASSPSPTPKPSPERIR